jgi:hypothetical protein
MGMLSDHDLTEAEHLVLQHAGTGQPLLLGSFGGSPRIRAELLIDLLTGTREPPTGGPRAIIVSKGHITGALELSAAAISCPVVAFVDCTFDEPVGLAAAQVGSFVLAGGSVPSIMADRLRASDSVRFSELTTSKISLVSAHVGGQLSLNGAQLECSDGYAVEAWGLVVDRDLWCFEDFRAVGGVNLGGARVDGSLSFNGATLINPDGFALDAHQLEVGREMACSPNFSAVGGITLASGHIHGALDLRGAGIAYENGTAFDATRLAVDGAVLAGDARIEGTFGLAGARIGGSLEFSRARIESRYGVSIDAENLTVGKDLLFGGGCRLRSQARLSDAQIDGIVDLRHTEIHEPGGRALVADRITVAGAVIGWAASNAAKDPGDARRLTVTGELSLGGAAIGGDLDLDGARLTGVGGPALYACDAEIDGNVYCRDIKAQGVVNLSRARIARSLWLDGTELRNLKGDALNASSLVVSGEVSMTDGFFADGTVDLTHAQVGNEVYLNGAILNSPGAIAVAGRRLRTGGDVRCQAGFTARGEVRFCDAQIGGRLNFTDAVLTGADRDTGRGVDLRQLDTTSLVLKPTQPPEGVVDLADARVGTFSDHMSTWPRLLRLDGFVYDQLVSESMGVADRLTWVSLPDGDTPDQPSVRRRPHAKRDRYAPGPYDELAAAYRRAGYPERARRVAIEKQWRRRSELNVAGKAWNWFLWSTVGYGYRTWLAALWLIALLLTGTVAFAALHPDDLHPGGDAPPWNAVLYTVDVVFPFIDLGEQASWQAVGPAAWWMLGLTIAGWLLVSAVVAGLTNALKRD